MVGSKHGIIILKSGSMALRSSAQGILSTSWRIYESENLRVSALNFVRATHVWDIDNLDKQSDLYARNAISHHGSQLLRAESHHGAYIGSHKQALRFDPNETQSFIRSRKIADCSAVRH